MSNNQQQRERCVQCSKIVYPQERLSVDSQIYHKACLRCKTCATTLAIHNYVNVRGVVYCKRHVPHESSGPKINVQGELVSPRLAAETAASTPAHNGMPPISPRNLYALPSPRGTYPPAPLSPRVPAQPASSPLRAIPLPSPRAQKAPPLSPRAAAPPSAPPTQFSDLTPPTVLVHTSSNSQVVDPEAAPNGAAGTISHSASSEEEDAHAGSPSHSPARSEKPKSDRPRKTSNPRKERSDGTQRSDKTETSSRSNRSDSSRDRTDKDKADRNLGVSSRTKDKKDTKPRTSGDHKPVDAAAAPEVAIPLAHSTAAVASTASPPLTIHQSQYSVPGPAPPPHPSPRSHLTSSYVPANIAPAVPTIGPPASHNTNPAIPHPHPHPPPPIATTPTSAHVSSGSGRSSDAKIPEKKKSGQNHDPLISGPLTQDELARFRGGEKLPLPATQPASQANTSPRIEGEHKVVADKTPLLAFAKQPENQPCADCGTTPAEWASANLGIFVCIACSGSHRALGTHISKVKSVLLDDWTQAELDQVLARGNSKAASVQQPVQLPPEVAMDKDTPQAQRNAVIRARYTGQPFVMPQQDEKHSHAPRKDTTKVVMAAGVLKINVIEGRNLPSKDMNGYSDPYVVIVQQGQKVGKTNKVKKTLNPKWNETVMVNLPSLSEKLTLQVWDWDRIGSHNFMGEAPLNLLAYALTANNPHKFWLGVFAKEKAQGEVQLELTYFPIG